MNASDNSDIHNDNSWKIDTALMYYAETDRVSALEGIIAAKKDFGEEHILSGKLVFDTLTGASASGAVPQKTPQTYTRPSGKAQYRTPSNTTPLDDTFRDTRLQFNVQWSQPISEQDKISTGIQLSREYDYQSIAVNGGYTRELNQKNTAIFTGLSFAFDTLAPEGGRPVPLSAMVVDNTEGISGDNNISFKDAFEATRQQGGENTRNTVDLMFGVTQVINRRWIMQLNYGYSQVDGYLTDPFKVVSVVNDQGDALNQLHENRPSERTKHNIYWQNKAHFDEAVFDLSYRYSFDDWKISSHAIESKLRWPLTSSTYIQPSIRYYQQDAAEFYTPFITDDQPIPEYASADYRIGKLTTMTFGAKYLQELENNHSWGVRMEYYIQTPKNAGFEAVGQLQDLELYEEVKAFVVQFNYSF